MSNILLHASITELNNKAVESFINSHVNDNFVLIYEMLEKCKFTPNIKKDRQYLTANMRNHDFRAFRDFFAYAPVDEDMLNKMSRYEGEIYKMMDTYFPPLSTFDERQRIYFDALRFFGGILTKYKIEVFILFGIPHQVYDYIMYCLCKCFGIKTFLIYRMPIRGYIYYFNDLEDHGKFFEVSKDDYTLPSDFEQSLNNYMNSQSGVKLYYMSGNTIKDRINKFRKKAKMLLRYNNKLKNMMVVRSLRKRKNCIDRLIKRNEVKTVDLNCKYIFVGLHYQPEGTTSPMAGIYVNQQLIIEMLSYYVPEDVYIYVKEHPNQNLRGEKNISFFSEISKMRNVVIIPTNFSSNQLVKNCFAVATCTGTVAYEAAYYGKPTFLFGNYLYNYLPNCFSIKNNVECKNAITEIMKKQYIFKESDMRKFLKKLSSIAYHAEFALGEKEYIVSSANVSLKENNNTIRALLNDIYRTFNEGELV